MGRPSKASVAQTPEQEPADAREAAVEARALRAARKQERAAAKIAAEEERARRQREADARRAAKQEAAAARAAAELAAKVAADEERARKEREADAKRVAKEEAAAARAAADLAALLEDVQALEGAIENVSVPPNVAPAAPRQKAKGPVVFLHIPKTAGSSVRSSLELLHGDRHAWVGNFFREPDQVRQRVAVLAARLADAAVIQGHLPLALRELYPEDARFITFLRDPTDRTVSQFFYAMARRDAWPGPGPRPRANLTLKGCLSRGGDYSKNGNLIPIPDNLQTRMLSGFDIYGPSSPKMLEEAKKNLRSLAFLGLAEAYDTSLALLHLTFGWRLVITPDVRVNHGRPSIEQLTPADLAAVRRRNQLDEELYAEGVAEFQRRCSEHGERLEIEAEAVALARRSLRSGKPVAAGRDNARAALVRERARSMVVETRLAALQRDVADQAAATAATVGEARRLTGRVAARTRKLAGRVTGPDS